MVKYNFAASGACRPGERGTVRVLFRARIRIRIFIRNRKQIFAVKCIPSKFLWDHHFVDISWMIYFRYCMQNQWKNKLFIVTSVVKWVLEACYCWLKWLFMSLRSFFPSSFSFPWQPFPVISMDIAYFIHLGNGAMTTRQVVPSWTLAWIGVNLDFASFLSLLGLLHFHCHSTTSYPFRFISTKELISEFHQIHVMVVLDSKLFSISPKKCTVLYALLPRPFSETNSIWGKRKGVF